MDEEFKGQFEYLGENTENYIFFSVPIQNEVANSKTVTYKILMSTSLSRIADDLAEGF